MGTIIVIVGAVLIALIVGIGAYYKRKLRKQYQEQPYQSVTGTDLEAEISGGEAYKRYKTRQDRLTMLVKALCAAVVIMGGLVYFSVTWWQESEPERIARAEQKRIEKVEQQRLQEEAEQKRIEQAEKQRLLKKNGQQRLQEEAKKQQVFVLAVLCIIAVAITIWRRQSYYELEETKSADYDNAKKEIQRTAKKLENWAYIIGAVLVLVYWGYCCSVMFTYLGRLDADAICNMTMPLIIYYVVYCLACSGFKIG